MRQVYADLWESTAFHVPGGPSTHAYLWAIGRDSSAANVLFYNFGDDRDLQALDDLGGVDHQYLSHQDEISPMLVELADRYGVTLHSSIAERDVVAETRAPDVVYDARHVDDLGVEVIPTPGHSPGSVCYLVDGVAGRYLFTGDTILVGDDGRWFAGYIPSFSDHDALVATLDLLATLRPDVVVSSAFLGETGAHRLDRPWVECVAEARDQLVAGVG